MCTHIHTCACMCMSACICICTSVYITMHIDFAFMRVHVCTCICLHQRGWMEREKQREGGAADSPEEEGGPDRKGETDQEIQCVCGRLSKSSEADSSL